MKKVIVRLLPDAVKKRVRSSGWYASLLASRQASGKRRIDLSAAEFARYLHLSKQAPLAGKTCLEIGSGWVPSHALVCHLLGARKVIATDIAPLAHPEFLWKALHSSIPWVVRDVLSPFEEHSLIRCRLNNLLSIRRFDFKVLKDLGIEYVSPIDFAKNRLHEPVDFIYSFAVLQLIPREDIVAVLSNIAADLNPGGTMLHGIHLEDSQEQDDRPFDFLAVPSEEYSSAAVAFRGNRIRKSGWESLFSAVPDVDSEFIFLAKREDKELPSHIDPLIEYEDEDDLRISHIGVYTRKHE